jgi:hypothetical protein
VADQQIVPVSWKEIAAANGRTVDEEVLSSGLSADPSEFGPSGEVLWNEPSRLGTLALQDVDRLVATLRGHTRTPNRCWFAIWEGWGDLTPFWRDAPSFSVAARKMHLLEGTIVDAFVNLGEIPWGYRSANLWWPDDRAWCVSSEIDFKWTYVGGSSDCIGEIVSNPSLEAYTVSPRTRR